MPLRPPLRQGCAPTLAWTAARTAPSTSGASLTLTRSRAAASSSSRARSRLSAALPKVEQHDDPVGTPGKGRPERRRDPWSTRAQPSVISPTGDLTATASPATCATMSRRPSTRCAVRDQDQAHQSDAPPFAALRVDGWMFRATRQEPSNDSSRDPLKSGKYRSGAGNRCWTGPATPTLGHRTSPDGGTVVPPPGAVDMTPPSRPILDAAALRDGLARCGRVVDRHARYLTRLDIVLGDGDHGDNLVIGFRAVADLLAELPARHAARGAAPGRWASAGRSRRRGLGTALWHRVHRGGVPCGLGDPSSMVRRWPPCSRPPRTVWRAADGVFPATRRSSTRWHPRRWHSVRPSRPGGTCRRVRVGGTSGHPRDAIDARPRGASRPRPAAGRAIRRPPRPGGRVVPPAADRIGRPVNDRADLLARIEALERESGESFQARPARSRCPVRPVPAEPTRCLGRDRPRARAIRGARGGADWPAWTAERCGLCAADDRGLMLVGGGR